MKKDVFSVYAVVVVFVSYLLGCTGGTSALVGKWVPEGQDISSDQAVEFFKDGSGLLEGEGITWTAAENGRLTTEGDGWSQEVGYNISGSTLTIILPNGNSVKYKKTK
jgi:hypothetical protein